MTNMRWYWECPICHAWISRSDPKAIEEHKAMHPKNQLAFTAGREEAKK
jgi:lipopolysaccharide biosynthesis regulator YciM